MYSRGKTPEEIEEIKKFRLVFGFILGTDIPGGSTQEKWSMSWSVGPRGEEARADRFAVFYKNGTYDFGRIGWWNRLPQGFSCGKGYVPTQNYLGIRFSPAPCHEIVLKVANKESCGREQFWRDFGGEDCFADIIYGPWNL